jgi:two-component system chemotaxis response regulator CheB
MLPAPLSVRVELAHVALFDYVRCLTFRHDEAVILSQSHPTDRPLAYGAVVIGASAGGVSALQLLLAALPGDFPLPILVVQHLSPTLPSELPAVLGYRTPLRVRWAEDGLVLRPGTVYVAPPDQHLLFGSPLRISLSSADRSEWWRPAVDHLFHSAAQVLGPRAIAVVLSGSMWDGAKGMLAVGQGGGITIVQDEASCEHFEMPAAALDLGRADVALSPRKIAQALELLAEMRA